MSYQMNTRTYVYGESSPFKKRFLLPFLVIRIGTMLGNFIVHAFALAFISQYRDEVERLTDDFQSLLDAEGIIAIVAVSFALITITLITDIVIVVQRCRRTLTPKFFLMANSVQTATWVVLLILSVFGATTGSILTLVVVTLGAFLALLFYAVVIFRRERKGQIIMVKAGSVPPRVSQYQGPASNINYSGAPAAAGPHAYQSYPNPPVYTANPDFANVDLDRKGSIESGRSREPQPPSYN